MKRNLIILLLVGFNLNLLSQDNTQKKLRLGLFFTYDKNMNSAKHRLLLQDDYYTKSYTVGLSAEYFLKNRFSFNSGLNYSNKDFTEIDYCLPCDYYGTLNQDIKRFIEIPLSLRYYFLPNKLKIYASIGLINIYELDERALSKYSISYILGAGIEYNLNSNLAFQTITEYNSGLTNMFKGLDFKMRTVSFGLGIVKKM